MKTLVLVQHCQSQHHVDRKAQLGPDSENGLTDLGRGQAEAAASRLYAWLRGQPCRLYSSDLTRAWQTAEIIGKRLQQPPMPAAELREGCGRRQGPLPTPIEPPRVGDRAWFLFDSRAEPTLETWREFHSRVCGGMERIGREHPADCVPIVVAHGGTLSNIVVWWLRLPLEVLPERTPFAASPGSISVLRANRYGNPVIGRLNDTAHLAATGLNDELYPEV